MELEYSNLKYEAKVLKQFQHHQDQEEGMLEPGISLYNFVHLVPNFCRKLSFCQDFRSPFVENCCKITTQLPSSHGA